MLLLFSEITPMWNNVTVVSALFLFMTQRSNPRFGIGIKRRKRKWARDRERGKKERRWKTGCRRRRKLDLTNTRNQKEGTIRFVTLAGRRIFFRSSSSGWKSIEKRWWEEEKDGDDEEEVPDPQTDQLFLFRSLVCFKRKPNRNFRQPTVKRWQRWKGGFRVRSSRN